jgi:hypothetical protein
MKRRLIHITQRRLWFRLHLQTDSGECVVLQVRSFVSPFWRLALRKYGKRIHICWASNIAQTELFSYHWCFCDTKQRSSQVIPAHEGIQTFLAMSSCHQVEKGNPPLSFMKNRSNSFFVFTYLMPILLYVNCLWLLANHKKPRRVTDPRNHLRAFCAAGDPVVHPFRLSDQTIEASHS